jgi:hypothetical protein
MSEPDDVPISMTAIYVLPTEAGLPPRAVLGEPVLGGKMVVGTIAMWTADMGCWTLNGVPLPPELSDTITEHAKSLGVEWD